MTIDDAIKHAEEMAKVNESWHEEYIDTAFEQHALNCKKCAEDHHKLANWLRRLKAIEDLIKDDSDYMEYRVGYLRKVMEECND